MNNSKPSYQDLEIRIKELEFENAGLRSNQIEISKAKELYLKIFDDFPALIWRSRLDKMCDYFNKTWLNFTGKTMEQEFGNGWTEGVHPEDFDFCLQIYINAFDKREPFQMDYRLKNKLGEYRWIRDFGRPFYDLDETFLGYIGSCYDITDNKEKESQLIKAKEKAEGSDRLKSAFLANMSHEIRTPMNAIIGFSDLLKNKTLPKEKTEKFLDTINNSGKRLLTIISDIIDISKIDANQLSINIAPCNINLLIDNLYTQFSLTIKNVKLRINKNLNDSESIIITDSNRINQILSNLLENAIKFTKEGSIEFGYNLNEKILKFYVKDSGIGIAKKDFNLVFERFGQAKQEYTQSGSGSGLGLSIAKGLVELLGGEIWVESEIDKGATFYFTIPYKIAEKSEVDNDKRINVTPEINSKAIILIAEDEESNFLYLEELLSDYKFTIVHAWNGVEAIEIFNKTKNIDFVLMDIKMPIMNGFEATKQIRNINNSIPIIAQTAYAMADDKDKALNAGCDDYISKPISRDKLFEILNKYINQK